MGKGKKRGLKGLVLLSIVVILIACCFMLVACGEAETKTTSGNATTGNATTGDSENTETGTETGSDTTETGGETGGQTGGETGGEVTPAPEKTPAEYKAECEEKITNAVAETLQAKYKMAVISDVELVKLNAKDGMIYARASHEQYGSTSKCFYSITSNLGDISKDTYKEISSKCDSISLTGIERTLRLDNEVTSEKYNDLCNYVLADVGLEGGTVLNATKFKRNDNAMSGTILTVLYNGKIATVEAYCHSGTINNGESIDYMLSSETNDIRITSYEDFKDFDYLNNEATMSAVSYNLNLGGNTIATKTVSGTFNMNLSEDFCQ